MKLSEELRNKQSRDNRALLDRAADRIDELEANYRKQSVGEWICNRQTSEYICSLCGAIGPVDCLKEDFYESNFCPNCGAKMKGGE